MKGETKKNEDKKMGKLADENKIRNLIALIVVMAFVSMAIFAGIVVYIKEDVKYLEIATVFSGTVGVIIGWYFGSHGKEMVRRDKEEAYEEVDEVRKEFDKKKEGIIELLEIINNYKANMIETGLVSREEIDRAEKEIKKQRG